MAGFSHRSIHLGPTLRTGIKLGAGAPKPPRSLVKAQAVWDTGATHSVISERMAAQLGLRPIGFSLLQTVQDQREAAVYTVWILIPNGAGGGLLWRLSVLGADLGMGPDFLIGMDILSKGDFHLTRLPGDQRASELVFTVER